MFSWYYMHSDIFSHNSLLPIAIIYYPFKSKNHFHVVIKYTIIISTVHKWYNVSIFCSRGDLTIERFVKIYDFRMNRACSPMQVHLDPMFLRFVPMYSERICVVSQVRSTIFIFYCFLPYKKITIQITMST